MPELDFVMPHWAYWSALLLFPLVAGLLYRSTRKRVGVKPVSLTLGYLLLLSGGFLGVHRLYVKSRWTLAFVLLFLAILQVNIETRQARDQLSAANNAVNLAEGKIKRAKRAIEKAEKRLARHDSARSREKLAEAQQALETGSQRRAEALVQQTRQIQVHERWKSLAAGLGIALLALMLIDALLLPSLVRKRNAIEQPRQDPGFECPAVEQEHDDRKEPFIFNRIISRCNALAGEFVAYWSLLAVFVYYYEVIARYVFNSPTNWAHESMFLMFGMQYLIAGGFCLRENAHVRVDVIYAQLPKRTQAIVDVVTSAFFFLFVVTLLITGWIFFSDAYAIQEVSFTEWGIQYWPIKLALPVGAVLLLLQGLAQLLKDIAVAVQPAVAELDTQVRPEG